MALEVVEHIELDVVFIVFEQRQDLFLDETVAPFEQEVEDEDGFVDYFLVLFLVDEVEGQSGGA